MAPTLEQQIDRIMDAESIDTLQLSAHRDSNGAVRFYTAMHFDAGNCVFSAGMNLPTVKGAIEAGLDAVAAKRLQAATVEALAPMADAA